MAYSDVIPLNILLDLARRDGAYFQLSLPLYVAEFTIREEYLTDVAIAYKWVNETGSDGGTLGHVDHPSFAELRNVLEGRGYIKTQRSWSNGDTVLKEFYFNGMYFGVDDRFPSACAQRNIFECERRRLAKQEKSE